MNYHGMPSPQQQWILANLDTILPKLAVVIVIYLLLQLLFYWAKNQ